MDRELRTFDDAVDALDDLKDSFYIFNEWATEFMSPTGYNHVAGPLLIDDIIQKAITLKKILE